MESPKLLKVILRDSLSGGIHSELGIDRETACFLGVTDTKSKLKSISGLRIALVEHELGQDIVFPTSGFSFLHGSMILMANRMSSTLGLQSIDLVLIHGST